MSERDADAGRHERTTSHPTPGPRNSLWHWPDAKSVRRIVYNYLLVVVARLAPSLRVKNRALARLGATVGEGVSWGLEATPDVFWPELVTLEDHCIVGYDATLLCHEFLQEEYRTGEVVVGERAMVGAGTIVLPGVRIGAGARVAANSLVTEDVPPGKTVAGVPAREVSRTLDAEDGGPGAGA
ncbi:acetyltransferase [Halobacteriales archaeon QS_5_70_17]|nr:MAG: acetyltransferase [Halobacteriales archaeon QS_5_70_17]